MTRRKKPAQHAAVFMGEIEYGHWGGLGIDDVNDPIESAFYVGPHGTGRGIHVEGLGGYNDKKLRTRAGRAIVNYLVEAWEDTP